ncbi:hypothetical protein [uncultured Amphritea sp.]|uniref:hypothetical protein n=1 Tax=Amphritea sp. TaxID=1872502 RepID=UPI0025F7A6D0|nr:hypothetical protein [uncultured Amphritea sp.]
MSYLQRYTPGYLPGLLLMTLLLISGPVTAMQLDNPRAAAVYIIKLRPLISACLKQADANSTLSAVWRSPPCQQLLDEEPRFTIAWQLLLPDGKTNALAEIPEPLRQPTVDTYSEYRQLAERIARLSR